MKPNKRRLWKLVSLLAACALLAAACGDGDDEETVADESTDASADDSTDTSADEADEGAAGDEAMEEGALPGEGVSVTMGRADWATGYIQAAIYRQILTELGYEVSDPAELELGPANAYTAMANGDFDFWTNSWYPGHQSWHQNELPDGTLVGDHLTIVDGLFQDSGVQGFLITKSVAEENGITSMQQVNDDPELVALFDDDGDGVADIYGCQESYTCDDIIENQIAFYGWDNIAQVKAGYDAMFAEATDKVNQGEPMMIYTWTPSSYVTELIPGDNVLWITMNADSVLDDSNPAGLDGGEFHDQVDGFTGLGPDVCTQPCQLGWIAADIQVTANTEFLDANPFLAALFPLIRPSVIDISILQVEQSAGDGSQAHVEELAAGWIDANRDLVDGWIDEAMATAG